MASHQSAGEVVTEQPLGYIKSEYKGQRKRDKVKAWVKEKPDEVIILGTFAVVMLGSVTALIWNNKGASKRAEEVKTMVENLREAAALRAYILEADPKIDEMIRQVVAESA